MHKLPQYEQGLLLIILQLFCSLLPRLYMVGLHGYVIILLTLHIHCKLNPHIIYTYVRTYIISVVA